MTSRHPDIPYEYTLIYKRCKIYFTFSTFSVLADWPGGSYALPRPIDGCPVNWKEGMRYQDSENVLNMNNHSKSYHLSGTVNKHGVRQEFCTKTDDSKNDITWPPGQYCIYKYGMSCPDGLEEGMYASLCSYCTVLLPLLSKHAPCGMALICVCS